LVKELELVAGDVLDVLRPEASEVVDRVAHQLAVGRAGADLFDRWEGTIPSRSPSWTSTGPRIRAAFWTGRNLANGISNPAALTSLRQPFPDASRSNPGSASGAAITANDPGAPATGIVTGLRVNARRMMLQVKRAVTPGGDGCATAASPSAIGTSATVAAMRGSAAAVMSACPPPSDIPQSATRSGSTPSSPRAYCTAACQSSSFGGARQGVVARRRCRPNAGSRRQARRTRRPRTAARSRGSRRCGSA
jgi:hypothetical protein